MIRSRRAILPPCTWLLAAGFAPCLATEPVCPPFTITFSAPGGSSYTLSYFEPLAVGEGEYYIEDTFISATIKLVGEGEWELALTNINPLFAFKITKVVFPWQLDPYALDDDPSDDFVVAPFLAGVAFKADALTLWEWWGGGPQSYPGTEVAPLLIVADDHRARITAAVNWPPKRVAPQITLDRQILVYPHEQLAFGQTGTYRLLQREVTGSSALGDPPWLRAADLYKTWLSARLAAAGLAPANYPKWLWRTHGFLNVQLEDLLPADWALIQATWHKYKDRLRWIQFWGQMSCHSSMPEPDGAPPCYGCCLLDQGMHPRYLEPDFDLLAFVQSETAAGFQAGFYSRPWSGYLLSDVLPEPGSPTNLQWWLQWVEIAKLKWGANASFHDTIATAYFGDPLLIAALYKTNPLLQNAVVEGASDLYPTAFLVSNALHYPTTDQLGAPGGFPGGPGRTVADLGLPDPDDPTKTITQVPFPQLAAYLLHERLIFNGQSNHGGEVWGKSSDYWSERQNFLLGWKYDVQHPFDSWLTPDVDNPALALAIKRRDSVKWWERRPKYFDRVGVSDVPPGVDVRRFVDREAVDLLVIENWESRPDLSFRFLGKQLPVPLSQMSIYVMSKTVPPVPAGAPSCPGDIDGDGAIGQGDLAVLLSYYGTCEGGPNWKPQADIVKSPSGTSCIDQADLGFLLDAFGKKCKPGF